MIVPEMPPQRRWRRAQLWIRRQWERAAVRRRVFLAGIIPFGFGLGVAYGSWSRACAGAACPSISVLEDFRPEQGAKVYAADGRLITELGIERRTVLPVDEIAPEVRAAFLAVEDKRFYQHNGIDYWRIPGAIKANLIAMRWAQGFSTITMQLARNVWDDRIGFEKVLRRKLREVRVAREIERTYDKDRILELYLNQIFMGGNLHGVESAAQAYFGKSARDLNFAEGALLAAVANRPGRYDPRKYPGRAIRRRNLVLNLMRDANYLTPEEAERWKAYPLVLSSRQDFGEIAPYFQEWIRQQLYARFGRDLYEEGYRVYTTLDLEMQIAAERALEDQLQAIEHGAYGVYRHPTYQEYLENLEATGAPRQTQTLTPYLQGALITMDARTGHVLAMVGGRDYDDSEFNRAWQARRQAGSTFKPFVYAAAIRAGKSASYMVDDEPISHWVAGDTMPWEPQNYEGDFRGPMTLRRGLFQSRNLVAVKLGLEIGTEAVKGEAIRFGVASPLPNYPSLFIGSASVTPLEMVSAFTAFATLGERATPIGILRVEDANGNIIWEPQPHSDRVMDEEQIWIVTNMLEDVVNRGTAYAAVRNDGQFFLPAGGKTGTTNDGTDVWFIGFTPELVTGVWMGFDTPQKIKANSAGGRLAAPAWTAFMKEVYARRTPPQPWRRPGGLITREVDQTTGYLATAFCPRETRYWEWFIPTTEPTEYCPIHMPFGRGISGGREP